MTDSIDAEVLATLSDRQRKKLLKLLKLLKLQGILIRLHIHKVIG